MITELIIIFNKWYIKIQKNKNEFYIRFIGFITNFGKFQKK